MKMSSYWQNSQSLPGFQPLDRDLTVDVAVVGGGITGVTAAYLFKQAGASVALFERYRCGGADTGRTTAHLTAVTDLRLNELVTRFGKSRTWLLWEAGETALQQIEQLVAREGIRCEFVRVPGYLMAPLDTEAGAAAVRSLQRDAKLALELEREVRFEPKIPYFNKPAVLFPEQAKFHPLQYLKGLLERIPGGKAQIFEHSPVTRFSDNPRSLRAGGHRVRYGFLLLATHTPLTGNASTLGALALQTKLSLYTSYVLGAELPRGLLQEALYWDTADPYYYLRVDRRADHDYLVFGGKDCKTGQENGANRIFAGLEAVLRRSLPQAEVRDRWLGQVIETNDGLPLIGQTAEREFVATGFAGNGMTFGTLAAMMARDCFLAQENPWQDLLDVRRKKLLGGTARYLKENADFPYLLLRDRLAPPASGSLDTLLPGEGRLLRVNGRKLAAYRAPDGDLTLLSPVCTHLKCLVRWNDAASTWDCPCHGSRFLPTGEVLSGPAEQPLKGVKVSASARATRSGAPSRGSRPAKTPR